MDRRGLSIHHQDEHECLFCHSQLNIEEIKLRVEKYKRNQVQKDTQRLSLILEKLKIIYLFNEAKIAQILYEYWKSLRKKYITTIL